MRLVLSRRAAKGAIRADRAWSFYCDSSQNIGEDAGFWPFVNWLWDELGERAGNLNADAPRVLEVTLPALREDALDFVLRLASFWATDVRLRSGKGLSGNLWRRPVVNLLDDEGRRGAERTLLRASSGRGSKELNLMPLLGPGRAFFSLQLIEKGDSSARMRSHTGVDEYYLVLEGRGTLRFNGRPVDVVAGDLIGTPTGPDAATHLTADRGERLRILTWRCGASGSTEPGGPRRTWSTGRITRRPCCEGRGGVRSCRPAPSFPPGRSSATGARTTGGRRMGRGCRFVGAAPDAVRPLPERVP